MSPAAIFDLDGVLVDSTPLHFRAWKRVAETRGKALDFDHFRTTIGTGNQDTFRSVFGDGWSDEDIRLISGEKEAIYREEMAARFVPIPGASDLVRELYDGGWNLAVATSAPPENVSLALELLPNGELLRVRVDASMIRRAKPNPEVFLQAAGALGESAENCVVIEDGVAGLTGARRAGMATLALTTTMSRGELFPVADMIRENLVGVDQNTLQRVLDLGRERMRNAGGRS